MKNKILLSTSILSWCLFCWSRSLFLDYEANVWGWFWPIFFSMASKDGRKKSDQFRISAQKDIFPCMSTCLTTCSSSRKKTSRKKKKIVLQYKLFSNASVVWPLRSPASDCFFLVVHQWEVIKLGRFNCELTHRARAALINCCCCYFWAPYLSLVD